MKVEFDLDDLLNHTFENCSDEELSNFKELLSKWVDKVEDELEYVNSSEDCGEDDD